MDSKSFEKYLNDRYYGQIEWYDKKSLSNQKRYRQYQFSLIVLSALTPVLIAIDLAYPNNSILQWIPIVTSVCVAVLTSILKTFKYQENWINYRTICETLKKEYYFYEAGVDEYGEIEDKDSLFVERVESLISRENTLWINICKEDKKGGHGD